MKASELKTILDKHGKWLNGEDGGEYANLRGADLRGADLRGADLRGADLSGADLRGADLSGADLSGADLRGADLRGADLSGADLSDANLRGADLRGADLSDADLSDANLSGADLRGAVNTIYVPFIPDIDKAVLDAVEKDGNSLEMQSWHTCETTHCLAGWIVTLAGEVGKALKSVLSTGTTAALIYAKSNPGVRIPDWYASNEKALEDLRKRAGAVTDNEGGA